jgi:hypothetical protein
VNGQTIQITTAEALSTIQRTEFYRVPPSMREQFDSKDAFIASLQSELQQRAGEAIANRVVQMHVDVPSGRLIVRGMPAVHQYLSSRLNSATEQ